MSNPAAGADSDDDAQFAPADLTDGRPVGDWETRYKDTAAQKAIRGEAIYICVVVGVVALITLLVWLETPNAVFNVSDERYEVFEHFAYGALGGALGGAIFDLKWLYHSVAHGRWNRDRRLWRLFTPVISGGLAFALILLASSGLIPLIDQDQIRQNPAVFGTAFLIGYFSDNAIAAMARLASSLFGEQDRRKPEEAEHKD